MASKNDAKQFYDQFGRKLVNDFVGGNPRMLLALEFMKAQVRASGARRILDIGCGIGWSSHELASVPSVEFVHAIDLSSALIETARRLFPSRKVAYETIDVLSLTGASLGAFDAVIMLDVYEHIPCAARPAFHKALMQLISPTGCLLLTCPTIAHQEHLRTNNPEGLQPVDEDVGLSQLTQLGDDTATQLDYYRVVSVWSNRDYLHAVLRRSQGTSPTSQPSRSRVASFMSRVRVRTRS
jgi:protein-L-isoaspartate O-methyltransferase